MSWASPWYLGWLLVLPFLAALLGLAAWLHRRRLTRLFSPVAGRGPGMLERVLPRSVRARRGARDVMVVLAFGLAILALAEPRFDKVVRTVKVSGTDLVVLLDLSRSMDARDVDPSRLERARREIADLGRQVEGDRVGLVVFAGGAYPRLPLTADYRALELVVSEVSPDTFDTQGSNLSAAIRTAIELLERSRQEAGQAMLVLSDGETHDPEDALAAAKLAAEKGIPIFTMGIGIEPSRIPLRDGRFLEWQGETVMTSPDFEVLKQVAKTSGGAFVTSNAASQDMESLYQEIRKSVRATERSSQRRETWQSAFQVPLGLSALLLLFGGWLGDGRRAFGAAGLVLAVGLSLATPARAQDPLQEADRLYQEQKYPQAVEKLVELSLERPDDPTILERLGSARYRAGDYAGAARAFDTAAQLRDDGGADDLFNSGNASYQAGRLEDAQARYDEVLAQQPDHVAAKKNREMVTNEIATRRAQKPPPPPQPGGEDQPQEEPKPGEKQDQDAPKPQPGDPKPGEPGADGEPQPGEGDPSDPGEPKEKSGAEQGAGTPRSNDDPEKPGTSGAVDPGQVSEDPKDGEPTDAQGNPTGEGEPGGPITSGQAHRLLDSVEEGSQRVVVQGNPEDRPW